jgi:hypothetical protein
MVFNVMTNIDLNAPFVRAIHLPLSLVLVDLCNSHYSIGSTDLAILVVQPDVQVVSTVLVVLGSAIQCGPILTSLRSHIIASSVIVWLSVASALN